MVGPAALVEQQVPVDPAYRPAIQVVDHRARITLAHLPRPGVRPAFLTTFGEQQLLVGPGVVNQLHVIEVLVAVPVKASAPDVLRCFAVTVDHAGSLDHPVAVVVPDHNFHVVEAGPVQRRAEVVSNEVAFLLCTVEAGVPALLRHRLVLHRDGPHRHALGLVRADEAHETLSPGGAALLPQPPAVVHFAVGLHPRWRTPGRHEQLDRRAGDPLCGLDEGQQAHAVALDAEALQGEVVGCLDVSIVAERKVARVHVHAAKAVAVTRLRVEVFAQQLLARGRAEPVPHGGSCFRECAAETLDRLEAAARVHEKVRQVVGVSQRLQRRLFGQMCTAIPGREEGAHDRVSAVRHAATERVR